MATMDTNTLGFQTTDNIISHFIYIDDITIVQQKVINIIYGK